MRKYTIENRQQSTQTALIQDIFGASYPLNSKDSRFDAYKKSSIICIPLEAVNDATVFEKIPEVKKVGVNHSDIIIILKPDYYWDNMPNQGIGIFKKEKISQLIVNI